MTTIQKTLVTGENVKREIRKSRWKKEQVVAHVQDKGLSFSLAGLDRIYRDELPTKDSEEILEAIAEKLGCAVSDFAEDDQRAS